VMLPGRVTGSAYAGEVGSSKGAAWAAGSAVVRVCARRATPKAALAADLSQRRRGDRGTGTGGGGPSRDGGSLIVPDGRQRSGRRTEGARYGNTVQVVRAVFRPRGRTSLPPSTRADGQHSADLRLHRSLLPARTPPLVRTNGPAPACSKSPSRPGCMVARTCARACEGCRCVSRGGPAALRSTASFPISFLRHHPYRLTDQIAPGTERLKQLRDDRISQRHR
jgi:hypothetical protein